MSFGYDVCCLLTVYVREALFVLSHRDMDG